MKHDSAENPVKIRKEASERVLNYNYTEGPLLILAGPGTGKTYSLRETIRSQLLKGFGLHDFFEATLTNAAADDFIADAKKEISGEFENSSTLHSLAMEILCRYARLIDRTPGFTAIDKPYEPIVIRDMRHLLGLSQRETKEQLKIYRGKLANNLNVEFDFARIYERLQKFYGAIDWFKVVKLACHLLENYEAIRSVESNKFQFLLIDEYQDLNPSEQRFVELLLNGRNNLLVVGDDDQSIYSFRYANPTGIVRFNDKYPNAHKIDLPVSSRLPSKVLDAAYSLICHNKIRECKSRLIPMSDTEERANGGFVISVNLPSGKQEQEFITKAIYELKNRGIPLSEILVLCNNKTLGGELIKSIQNSQYGAAIPIQDDLRSKETADVLGHIKRFLTNQEDNFSLRVILDILLKNNIKACCHLVDYSLEHNVTIWQAITSCDAHRRFRSVKTLIDDLVGATQEALSFSIEQYQLRCFLLKLEPFGYLLDALEADEESPEEELEEAKVRCLTLHSSKGLEADFVFIPFMEKSVELSGVDIEEKRRLFYVAITRAKVGVIFSWAWSRVGYGKFKSQSGRGGEPKSRESSPFIVECGIKPNFWLPRESADAAIDVVTKYAKRCSAYDNLYP